MPGVASHFPVFSQKAIRSFLNHFGRESELLTDAAAKPEAVRQTRRMYPRALTPSTKYL